MADLLSAAFVLVILLAAAVLGQDVLPRLPEHHRSRETIEVVRLVSSLMVTFAALVLGLLTANVNSAFFNTGNDMNGLAGAIRQTDNCLRAYGPDAEPARALLRQYTAGALFGTWPEEGDLPGAFPRDPPEGPDFESIALGDVLQDLRIGILKLEPTDALHTRLVALCTDDFAKLLDDRWKLIGEAHSTISLPFYRVLVFMLASVFASFGLGAPRNALARVTLLLAAFTIAISIFVVLELDSPLDGLIKVSSATLRATLLHLDAP